MKIYTFMSPSHYSLGKGWENTIKREPLAEPRIILLPIESNGDYRNSEWKDIQEMRDSLTCGIIHENIGSIIGITGADVRFIRPFVDDIRSRFQCGFDMLFQDEDGKGKYFNPDVMFIKCTPETLRAWIFYCQLLPHWKGDMAHQNRLMRIAFMDLNYMLLPEEYATPINGGIEQNPFLFHANNIPPPDSVQKKLEALKKYES